MKIAATEVGGLPYFVLPYRPALRRGYERIKGFARLGDYATFPAYPPFGPVVANDLILVFPDADWTDGAAKALEVAQSSVVYIEEGPQELPGPIRDLDFVLPPFDHQIESLIRAYLYPRTALLLDCGLGKTKVTIDLIRACKLAGEDMHALVLAPSGGIVVNWARQIREHGPELNVVTTSTASGNLIAKKRRTAMYASIAEEAPDVFVTSYGCLVNDASLIKNAFRHTMLVCDESHYLQTPTSKRTKHVRKFATCPRRILLSGTASQGSPVHLFGQLAVLAPYLVGDLWKFKTKFLDMVDGAMCVRCKRRFEEKPRNNRCWNCFHDEFRTVPIVVGFKNIKVLNRIVTTVAIRKSAEECLDLPPLRTIDVPYRLPAAAQKLYNSLVQSAQADLLDGKRVSTPQAAQCILKLLQILAGFVRSDRPDPTDEKSQGEIVHFDNATRMQVLQDLIEAIFASADSKVIIWGHFIESMNIIERFLTKNELEFVRVDGSTPNRETLRTKFETDPDCRIYLGQVQTGIGIDLVAANYVIYADLPFFSWSHYKQSLKRAHRIGQTRAVTVYRLFAEGSIHEYVLSVLDTKDSLVQSLVNNNLCGLCKHARACMEQGVKPFDDECLLARNYVSKPKAKLTTI